MFKHITNFCFTQKNKTTGTYFGQVLGFNKIVNRYEKIFESHKKGKPVQEQNAI